MSAAEPARFPLLAQLSHTEREVFAEAFELEEVGAGITLFREGEPADGALFVATGRVRVHTAGGAGGEAEFGAGEALGTLSLVIEGPRLASAETLSRTRLWRLRRQAFRNLLRTEPVAVCHLLEGMLRDFALALRDGAVPGSHAVDPR